VRRTPSRLLARSLSLSLLGLIACRSLPFPEPHLEGEYGMLLKKWTRQKALYSGLETRAFAQVVYHAPELVDAQAVKVADMRAEPAPQRGRTIQAMRAEASTPTFMVILRTPDRNWNDLESKKSIWRIAIDYGAGQYEPTKVERIERPFSAELQTLYPYIDEYSVAYRIHFPASSAPIPPPTGTQRVLPRLVIAGALGQMDFDWAEPQR
jgi:hypothetical protein